MLGSQQFCVRWNSYQTNLQDVFPKLLNNEHFVDVTLACEAQMIKCHKVVLSACSTYFEQLLVQNPCQHPIIFMKDMRHWEVQALVDFMYKGEVNVSQEELALLLKAAEALQIRGLCGADRQQDGNAVSLPPETTLSDSGGRESPPSKKRKFPEPQNERREKQQSSAASQKSNNASSSSTSASATPTSSNNDVTAGVSGPVIASVTSTPFRDSDRNNSSKEAHADDVLERSNIKREHLEHDDSYFENDVDYDSFDIKDDSNSMNPDISMPTSPMDQAGPSGMAQGSEKSTAAHGASSQLLKGDSKFSNFCLGSDVSMISSGRMLTNADMQQYLRMLNVRQVRQYSQHLERVLGSTARRGRPKRDDPSLRAAANLVMDRFYTLRQAALQFQIPPTTLRNYMKRTGMLHLPLKRGRPVSSGSSYHFYTEPFLRMPASHPNTSYHPRPNPPQYQGHQQQYQQQFQQQQQQQQAQQQQVPQQHQSQLTQQQQFHSAQNTAGQQQQQHVNNQQQAQHQQFGFNSSIMAVDPLEIFKPRRNLHSQTLIQLCLIEIANGCSVNSISRRMGVPRTTLLYHMKRKGIVSALDRRGHPRQTVDTGLRGQQVENITCLMTPTFSATDYDDSQSLEGGGGSPGMNMGMNMGMGMGISPGKARIRRSEDELRQAAECVMKGSTFQTVSDQFGIPISTIRFFMARRGILPVRRRGRSSGTSNTGVPQSSSPHYQVMHYKLSDIDKPL